ncbi:CamS family sex pheromone protein [Brevibacillus laterosporus]|uniref:Protein involved in sex pheromone biosynthesis n=2 Tax=Brevibacillus TaxID=55080 RepID=A0A0F7EGK3_BRELA|nr:MULTISPECIES: CamS family sex pheromone protein [Brevibacillus]AKF93280.1 protein involved in sex pheromone biosynthesis [Brevibacillus laterosporus]MCR8987529.1 CamS family sex pheromone protein [Brevibacillus laterosporus]MCZ0833267.1 CamS family sex pheromone protein [Brevibacillus halotolerans]GIO02928.1 putative lipoprotein YerH [Brevibacillus halotolerans]
MKTKRKLVRYLCILIACSVLLSACSLLPGKKDSADPVAPAVSSVLQVDENYYGSAAMPYQKNQTRGMLSSNPKYRIDFSHLEYGMMEIAKESFSPSSYLFQEGQRISRKQVTTWIEWEKKNPEGLNPDKANKLLVNVLEHNYLDKKDQKLAGIVLGLSLSPIYQDPSGLEKRLSVDELRSKGQQIAAKIVMKVRAENPQIPLVVAMYQVPESSSNLVPGNFIMSGIVNANDSSVAKWQPINEEYFLLPGDAAYSKYPQASLQFEKLMKQGQSFFQEFVGMTGTARFLNGDLTELTINATAEYDSRTEVIQFTQMIAQAIDQYIDKRVHVNFYVQSINQPLAIYVRPADGKSYMHIYRN